MESNCYKYAYYSTHFVGAFVSHKTISITIRVQLVISLDHFVYISLVRFLSPLLLQFNYSTTEFIMSIYVYFYFTS